MRHWGGVIGGNRVLPCLVVVLTGNQQEAIGCRCEDITLSLTDAFNVGQLDVAEVRSMLHIHQARHVSASNIVGRLPLV